MWTRLRALSRSSTGGLPTPDLGCFALLVLFWALYVWPLVAVEQLRSYDVFRDVGSATNFQQRISLADPAYRGETLAYPPLSPLVVAGLASFLAVSPTDVYRWSQLVFNFWIPAGMFLVVRSGFGRRAALGATVALLFAMPWWQTHVAVGQPSWHAVVLGWFTLWLYARQRRLASDRWAAACGLWQGLCFWQHPVIPAALSAAFVLETLWVVVGRGSEPTPGRPSVAGATIRRTALIAVLTLVVAGPVLYLMMRGPTRNTIPHEFLAPELETVEFALLRGNPWPWAMGLAGLVATVQHTDLASRLLVSIATVALLGQLPGYLRLFGPAWARHVPMVVPHEFQMLFQLAWAVAIGVGIDRLLTALAVRSPGLAASRAAGAALAFAAFALTGGRGLVDAPVNLRRYLHPFTVPPAYARAALWIRDNTDLDNVFVCDAKMAFQFLNPETGRKVWITSPGHSNPRVDWARRERVLRALRDEPSPQRFWHLARRSGIDYCIPSPEWSPKILADPALLREAIPRYLELVHGGKGAVPILRIVEPPRAGPDE